MSCLVADSLLLGDGGVADGPQVLPAVLVQGDWPGGGAGLKQKMYTSKYTYILETILDSMKDKPTE